jgi:hypothetical protein
MEVLTTYGWGILGIAIVLAVLIAIGIFNGTYSPKAQPGTCTVVRPNGPGSTVAISIQGVCNGEPPKYVSSFSGSSDSFVAINSIILYNSQNLTVTFWVEEPTAQPSAGVVNEGSDASPSGWYFDTPSTQGIVFSSGGATANQISYSWGTTQWVYVVGTFYYPTGTMSLYVNGKLVQSAHGSWSTQNTPIVIGQKSPDFAGPFSGYVSNLQMYNSALSANSILTLYKRGVGGAPININNLAGWWPLNGDGADYSGNDNYGMVSAITYVSSWQQYYTPP